MNVADLLSEQVALRPASPALTETRRGRDRTISFDQLDRRSAQAAAMLHQAGLRPGDRVLVLCPMSIDLYVALLAAIRGGMTATFLDPGAGLTHVEQACAIAEPRGLIAEPRAHLLRLICAGLRRIPRYFLVRGKLPIAPRLWHASQEPADRSPIHCSPEDPALLTFTSGSTGRPKAAVRTHAFLLAQLRAIHQSITMRPGETELATMPVFVLASLAAGVHSVIAAGDLRHPGRIAADPVLRQVARHRPMRCIASPSFLDRLAAKCAERQITLESLTRIYTGGAPVFLGVLQRLHQAAPQAIVTAVYGSTEAEPIASISLDQMSREDLEAVHAGRGMLAGPPEPRIELRVIGNRWGRPVPPMTSDDFRSCWRAPRAPGEIVVTGEHVLGGYLHGIGNEETKFQVDHQTWHRTGDAGYLDEQGRLWLLGRAAASIRDEHGEIYPFAVEAVIDALEGVQRSALVAHEGRRILVVEPSHGIPPGLADNLRQHLSWANIDRVLFVPRLPVDRRHNAKVDYPALAALVARKVS